MISLLLCLCASPSAAPMQAAQWNQFRGPGGRGVAVEEVEYPSVLDPDTNLLWEQSLPGGHSSPVLFGENLFVTACDGEILETICIASKSGEVRWRRALEVKSLERMHDVNSAASSTPAADGERVYAYFGSFGLIAYGIDGEEAWRRPLPQPKNSFGTATSPILFGDKLLFVHDANDGSYVEAINPESGATLWRRERPDFKSGWSTPCVWSRNGRQELLVYGVGWLTAYDLEDGTELWAVPGLTDEPIVMPATSEGLVFVTSYNMKTNSEVVGLPAFGTLVAQLDRDEDGTIDREEAQANTSVLSRHDADGEGDHPLRMFFSFLDKDEDGELTALEWEGVVSWVDGFSHANGVLAVRPPDDETQAAQAVWQYPHGVPECPSPLYYRGSVYLVKNGGLATCLDAESGELTFQDRLNSRGPWYSSPVAADGMIYAASARGVVTVFKAQGELEILSNNDLDERIMATPALSGGVVFVRTESRILAFSTNK